MIKYELITLELLVSLLLFFMAYIYRESRVVRAK